MAALIYRSVRTCANSNTLAITSTFLLKQSDYFAQGSPDHTLPRSPDDAIPLYSNTSHEARSSTFEICSSHKSSAQSTTKLTFLTFTLLPFTSAIPTKVRILTVSASLLCTLLISNAGSTEGHCSNLTPTSAILQRAYQLFHRMLYFFYATCRLANISIFILSCEFAIASGVHISVAHDI